MGRKTRHHEIDESAYIGDESDIVNASEHKKTVWTDDNQRYQDRVDDIFAGLCAKYNGSKPEIDIWEEAYETADKTEADSKTTFSDTDHPVKGSENLTGVRQEEKRVAEKQATYYSAQ